MTVAESLTGELLSTLPSGPAAERPPSMYVGGGSSEHSTASSAVVVAFESAGWADMKGAILTTVVRPPRLSCPMCSHMNVALFILAPDLVIHVCGSIPTAQQVHTMRYCFSTSRARYR